MSVNTVSSPASTDLRWLSGKRWQLAPVDNRLSQAMTQRYGVSPAVADLLVQRDIPLDDVESYLSPSLRDLMPDPLHLHDMDKAVSRLAHAVSQGETIGIFGDYDVDGATSSALLLHYFRQLGCQACVHIPDRQKEGYGPNMYGFQKLREHGAKLIITVDTGTLAHDTLAEAAQAGFEVIVLDHHQGEPQLPTAHAVVNPNRFDEQSAYGNLAAVGVTFLTLVALQSKLRETHSALPDLRWLLDIVALGTVCDVVPLTGLNRAFVTQGLKIMGQRQNPGLAALMDIGRLEEAPNPYHLGFVLGPRINAGGRVGKSDLGVRLLTATSYEEAIPIAEQLDLLNKERQAIESDVVEAAQEQVTHQQGAILLAQGNGWHEGVIGIAAGRLKEKYNQPAAVISWNEEGVGKASARSVKGVDLGQAIIAARQQNLLEAGGGHAMAAGFTVLQSKFDAFADFMQQRLETSVSAYMNDFAHHIDAALPLTAITVDFVTVLEQVGPFGAGNPSPRFLLPQVTLSAVDVLKEKHLRCILSETKQVGSGSARVKAMGFNMVESELGQKLIHSVGHPFAVIVRLKRDMWQGRESVGVTIEDVAAL